MTVPFGHQNEHFKSSLFLVLMNRLMTCFVAIACLLVGMALLWTSHVTVLCIRSEPHRPAGIAFCHTCLPLQGVKMPCVQCSHLVEGLQTMQAFIWHELWVGVAKSVNACLCEMTFGVKHFISLVWLGQM